jgi:formylglycine-generating enzyme required for sulfatase activity
VGDTTQVGNYLAGTSPYEALNMAGNVWEWVADWHDGDYYSISPYNNPPGPDTGTTKVLRGGGWDSTAHNLRVADRHYLNPSYSSSPIGFRCAKDAP